MQTKQELIDAANIAFDLAIASDDNYSWDAWAAAKARVAAFNNKKYKNK